VSERLIYQSSNGDCWFFEVDPIAGKPAVKHVANAQSGGHIAYLDIESFTSGTGPEHEALRQLLNAKTLATLLIAYDVHPAVGSRYDGLTEAIQSLGAWWHHLETVWIVRSGKTPIEIRDQLQAYIGADDQLLVLDITTVKAEWAGVDKAGSSWLKENIDRKSLA
jgi:hypothetical protein